MEGAAELARPVGAPAAKSVDCSSSGEDLAAVRDTARDQEFIATMQRDAISVDEQRVTALDDNHVFIVRVHVRRRLSGLAASPKRHLATVEAVENIAFHPGVA